MGLTINFQLETASWLRRSRVLLSLPLSHSSGTLGRWHCPRQGEGSQHHSEYVLHWRAQKEPWGDNADDVLCDSIISFSHYTLMSKLSSPLTHPPHNLTIISLLLTQTLQTHPGTYKYIYTKGNLYTEAQREGEWAAITGKYHTSWRRSSNQSLIDLGQLV